MHTEESMVLNASNFPDAKAFFNYNYELLRQICAAKTYIRQHLYIELYYEIHRIYDEIFLKQVFPQGLSREWIFFYLTHYHKITILEPPKPPTWTPRFQSSKFRKSTPPTSVSQSS